MSFTDIFTGNASAAGDDEQKGLLAAMDALQRGTAQARGEGIELNRLASDNANRGFQAALETWNAITPRQAQVVSDASVGAQGVLQGGLMQAHNALLGNPVDYSFANPQRLNYEMPQYAMPEYHQAPREIAAPGQEAFDLQALPPEAHYLRGIVASGDMSYADGINALVSGRKPNGEPYGQFAGIDRPTAERLLAAYAPKFEDLAGDY